MKARGRLLRDYPFPEPKPEPEPKSTPTHPRPRTATLRGIPLLRPPSRPPSIVDTSVDTVVVDTDPDAEVTKVTVQPRAECTSCGYLARHVHAFPEGLCGLCRTTVGITD